MAIIGSILADYSTAIIAPTSPLKRNDMDIKDKAIEYAYNNATLGLSPEMAIRAYIAGATEALQSQWHEISNTPKHNHAVIVKCEINPDDFTEG